MTSAPQGTWLVDPVWTVRDGFLQPVDWSNVPRSDLAEEIVQVLEKCPVQNASLLFRGSILEQAEPHPEADVDVMILTEDRRAASFDLSTLCAFGRPVDAVLVERGRHSPDNVLWTAACTRALYVAGATHLSRPVRLDRQLLVDHWLKYAAFSLPPTLHNQGLRRLAEVKQVIRAIGLVHGLASHQFSRDLATCLNWAMQESPGLGNDAASLFNTVSNSESAPYDITRIQAWLRLHFYDRITNWQ